MDEELLLKSSRGVKTFVSSSLTPSAKINKNMDINYLIIMLLYISFSLIVPIIIRNISIRSKGRLIDYKELIKLLIVEIFILSFIIVLLIYKYENLL